MLHSKGPLLSGEGYYFYGELFFVEVVLSKGRYFRGGGTFKGSILSGGDGTFERVLLLGGGGTFGRRWYFRKGATFGRWYFWEEVLLSRGCYFWGEVLLSKRCYFRKILEAFILSESR